jgi:hypothetical protein
LYIFEFRVEDLAIIGFGVKGLGFRVQGSRCKV